MLSDGVVVPAPVLEDPAELEVGEDGEVGHRRSAVWLFVLVRVQPPRRRSLAREDRLRIDVQLPAKSIDAIPCQEAFVFRKRFGDKKVVITRLAREILD